MVPQQQQHLAKDDKDLEAVMASELNALTLNDRNLVQEEIHCVRSMAVKETPTLVNDALERIRQRTTQISLEGICGSDAFREAFALNLPYVHSPEICLKYLRVDFFEVELAAMRMMNNLELLFRYFGLIALQRPLRFSDLDKEEQDCFRAGSVQILSRRDRGGRLVTVHQETAEGVNDYQRLRLVLYNHATLSEDEETQKHGIIIIFAVGERMVRHIRQQQHAELIHVYANLPYRMIATHLCFPDGPAFQFVKAYWIIALASQDQRIRSKFHGNLSLLETQYSLMTYGIPVHQLPRTHTGNIKTKNHLQWIKTRRAIDKAREMAASASHSCNIIEYPRNSDVLFSRGGNAGHPGNIDLQQDIVPRLEDFKTHTDKETRQKIRQEVYDAVKRRGGRFLTLNKGGWWEELPWDKAHEKITTSFYDYKRKKESEERRQDMSPTNSNSVFLLSSKRLKLGKGSPNCGCFCDPFEGSKMVNVFF